MLTTLSLSDKSMQSQPTCSSIFAAQERSTTMYGSIFRMKVKPGKEQAVVDSFKRWDKERRPKAKGAVAALDLTPEQRSGARTGIAVFKDKADCQSSATRPEHRRWYRQLREL